MLANQAVLPEGVAKDDFLTAVTAFQAVVGADNVLVDADRLVPYLRIMLPVEVADYQPAGVILVTSVAQIQAVLAICNDSHIPVWPISTGGNFGYGSTLPAVPGQMILDLGRMNRILEVDAELCTALVEPGVTYDQLYEYLNANEIPLWLSVPGPGPLVGPMGQALERGQGYTAYSEQFESVCGMEVVLADGTVLRTGLGGVAGSTNWQSNKYGYGPYLDGIFSQSNYGIVTKLGLWLMPRPPGYKIFAASFDNFDDIEHAVNAARTLKLGDVVQGPLLVGVPTSSLQMIYGERSKVVATDAPVSRQWLMDYTAAHHMPRVGAFGALYGTPDEIAAKYAVVKAEFHKVGGTVVDELFLQLSPLFPHMVDSLTGRPDLQEMNLLNWVGGGGAVWFAPLCPARGKDAVVHVDLAWSIMEKHGFDYNGGFFLNGRSLIHVMTILFDKSDPAAQAKAYECFNELLTGFAAKGYTQYRSNIAFMAQTAATYGAAQKAVNLKIKQALDPNFIIAPGKVGIAAA